MRTVLLAAFAAANALPAAPPAEDALLTRAQERIQNMLKRVPRYTCSVAIARKFYEPTLVRRPASCAELLSWKLLNTYGLTYASIDRLKLDVAIADEREIFSWHGAETFDSRGLH